jgi:hypothetical protein
LSHAQTPQSDELSYLHRRYDEEMLAAAKAQSRDVKIAHFEMALRYALRAREARQLNPSLERLPSWALERVPD